MDQWVKDGTPPPASTYPKIADGTLVPLSKWAFPKIPGVNKPHEVSLAYHLDFGPQWKEGIVSIEPPKVASRSRCSFRNRTPMETIWAA